LGPLQATQLLQLLRQWLGDTRLSYANRIIPIDSEISQKDTVTTQGDLYAGSEGATIVHSILFPPDNVNLQKLATLSGGNVLARWNHVFSSKADTSLQFYFDRYTRSGPESMGLRPPRSLLPG